MNEEHAEIERLEERIGELKERLAELRRRQPRGPVEDYAFAGPEGAVRLSELFGDGEDLIVVHHMGRSCPYCTLWADGYNGLLDHLRSRAAFVVVSPDPPAEQRAFAAERGWRFSMVSDHDGAFTTAMGYRDAATGALQPGVTTFHKEADGGLTRVATAPFGPGDDFCAVWPFFDLLAEGPAGWEPK